MFAEFPQKNQNILIVKEYRLDLFRIFHPPQICPQNDKFTDTVCGEFLKQNESMAERITK